MAYPVAQYARKYGIPIKLGNALVGVESAGRPGVRSPKGATGLTQVMPSTYVGMYGGTVADAIRKLKNPVVALDAGFRYLAAQYKTFGTWRLALAAYNAGPGAVKKYGGVPPYDETQNYVRAILRAAGALGGSTARIPGAASTSLGGVGGAPAAPLDLSGLEALIEGRYDPTEQLQGLLQAPTGGASPADTDTPAPANANRGQQDISKWVNVPAARGKWPLPGPQVLGFVAGIAQSFGQPLSVVDTTTHSRMTTSGRVSAHTVGKALDIPAAGDKLRRLGYLALIQAGMPKAQALKAAKSGGLFNVGGYQIIFATNEGGNHFDHLHVGVRT